MLNSLEEKLGYHFKDRKLLETALTHSSYANENRRLGLEYNERLEFLGDSILGFVVADHLFRTFPERPEGELTRLRAELVCEKNLALVAQKLDLGSYLYLGHGEALGGGRTRASLTSDAVEAVLAATYLDGGFASASDMVHRLILADLSAFEQKNADYKTELQELIQQRKNQTLHYRLAGESGPDHAKVFRMEVLCNGKVIGSGEGKSKKQAEQAAAKVALETIH